MLSDFGIAQSLLRGQPSTSRTGHTVVHVAERCQGVVATAASDIYSLAVMAFQMLTGRLPFQAEEPLALVHQHISQPPPSPCSFNPQLPAHVEATLFRSLAKEPGQRFHTAMDFVNALASQRKPTSSQQRRWRAVLALGVFLIGLVLGLWAWTGFDSRTQTTPTPTVMAMTTTSAPTRASTLPPTSTIVPTILPTSEATNQATSGTVLPVAAATAPPTPTAAPTLPVAQCSHPEIAQITSPRQGQIITSTVDVTGTAAGPRFDRYEFDYRRTGGDVWHQYLGLSWTKSIANGVLGVWNPYEPSLKLPLGEYQLRLRVVDKTANYKECVVTFSFSDTIVLFILPPTRFQPCSC